MDKNRKSMYESQNIVHTKYGDTMKEENYVQELINGLNMGMIAIDHLIDKIESPQLIDVVNHQRRNYGDLLTKVHHQYPDANEDKVKNKFMLETMVEMKSMMSDDAKIAKMLTEGSNQAVMTMTHLLNKDNNVSPAFQILADELEDISKKYIEELKEFI